MAPNRIDATVLTHAHIDHTGWLPRLAAQGFRGTTYASLATAEIVPVVLADAAHLQAEDVAWKKKRHAAEGRQSPYPLEPLYDQGDVDIACRAMRGIPFGEAIPIAKGMTCTLFPSGHILGASTVLLTHKSSGKTLVFSGDLGRRGRPLVPDPAPPKAANMVVIESTYGDRLHEDSVDVPTQLAEVINGTLDRGGTLLIPCFAVERAQELIYHLQQLLRENRIRKVPIFLDSPMAIKLLDVFRHHPEALDAESRWRMKQGESPFDIAELHISATRDDSKRINDVGRPCIIIAGSGMCTGGRIKHHLSLHIENPKSTLLFVGYQASGTLGRQILEGAREVRLFGSLHPVALKVHQIHGFSGHADRNELLDWLGQMPGGPQRVAVVHGGSQVTASFASEVSARFHCDVVVPTFKQRVQV